MSVNVVIVGPPRSGTSMMATVFKRRGYFVTENEHSELQEANEFNPHGFWEAEAVKNANIEVFRAAGFEFANTWMFDAITDQQVANIHEIKSLDQHKKLVDAYETHAPWLWKDPCLCYTLGYWWPLLKQHNTKVIVLKRNPREIYQSFLRLKWNLMNKDDELMAFKRIEHHMATAEQIVQRFEIPHIVVNYSDFAKDPEKTAAKIGSFFEIDLSVADLGYDKKLRTSGFRGQCFRLLDGVADCMPDALRKGFKKMIPGFVWKVIFPLRYMKKIK